MSLVVPALTAMRRDLVVTLGIDTDNDARTGGTSLRAVDALVTWDGTGLTAKRWTGSAFAPVALSPAPRPPTMGFRPGTLTFTLPTVPLGIGMTSALNIWSQTVLLRSDGSPDTATADLIPVPYAMTIPHMRVVRPAVVPARPRAGARFTVTAEVVQIGTGRPPEHGRISCRLFVAGRYLSGVAPHLAGNGRATCIGRMPVGTAGKPLRGYVGFHFLGVGVTGRVRATVR